MNQHSRPLRLWLIMLAVLIAIGVVGCGSAHDNGIPTFDGPGKCDDTAQCAPGFEIDGVGYGLSCERIRPELVGSEVLATGTWNGEPTEVRRVNGVDANVLVAIRLDAQQCDESKRGPRAWRFGFHGDEESVHAVCAAIVKADRARNQC